MLLSDIISGRATRSGNEAALQFDDGQLTFRQLDGRVTRLSRALAAVTNPGARVAILAENCPAYVECYYAVPRAGRVLVPLNYRLAESELLTLLLLAEPSILIVGPEYAQVARSLARALPFPVRLVFLDASPGGEDNYEELTASGATLPDPGPVSASDPAWLMFTSGTTGFPKGVVLTHQNIVFSVLNSALAWGIEDPGSLLFPWPMFHVAGYAILEAHLEGSTVHLMRRFRADGALEAIERHAISSLTIAPTMLNMLLDEPGSSGRVLSSLRTIYYGAARMPVEILRRAMERLPMARFRTGFGMTELSGLAVYLSDGDHRTAAGGRPELLTSVGRPMPLTRLRIVDHDLRDVTVGEVGEIVVAGEQVATRRWEAGKCVVEQPVGGWLRTGDLARLDTEGYFYVVDRLKDMIITGGENVYSLEVEAVLSTHPAVAMVAVFGLPDDHWGEVVVAAVQRVAGAHVESHELMSHARGLLAGYKVPRRIYFLDNLSTNASGKVLKRELRKRFDASPPEGT